MDAKEQRRQIQNNDRLARLLRRSDVAPGEVQAFLEEGCDPNGPTSMGSTAFAQACDHLHDSNPHHQAIMALLIEAGGDVHQDYDSGHGNSLLGMLMMSGNPWADVLVPHLGNPYLTNQKGENLLHAALHGLEVVDPGCALYRRCINQVMALVAVGVDVVQPDNNGVTPRMLAAGRATPEVLEAMALQAPDFFSSDEFMWALRRPEQIRCLLDLGADPRLPNTRDQSPFGYATGETKTLLVQWRERKGLEEVLPQGAPLRASPVRL
jgi:hypothetical protein